MLREFLQHLLISADPAVKSLGYVRESIAIESRYKRCRNAWQSHLEACRREILLAAGSLTPGSHIVIVGSGGLYDVPLEELRERGLRLSLVDIVHLPATRRRYRQDEDVHFIEVDVTGRVDEVYYRQDLVAGSPPDLALDSPPDLVVSLNILSQLALVPAKCLEKAGVLVESKFTDTIMLQHLDWLEHFGCPVVLLSDMTRNYLENKSLLEQEKALPDSIRQRLGSPQLEWDWHIAPPGEVDRRLEICHRVGSWKISPKVRKDS
ncbi:hypothetical protein [Emcibacter sp.]|uniref:hypothetical protein n=1 Tax=Emcibacter sp. TaxID=1979954 RepID=UPI003A8D072B